MDQVTFLWESITIFYTEPGMSNWKYCLIKIFADDEHLYITLSWENMEEITIWGHDSLLSYKTFIFAKYRRGDWMLEVL